MVSVHSLSALGTDDRFVTSSIPVGIPIAGEDARTTYSSEASRFSTDLRMASPRGPIRTFIESDFAGSGQTVRLRHAFLQTNRFVVGQTWSTFSDPEAEPIGIDFEGLNAISLFRQPLFRFTSTVRSKYQLALALENPAPDLTGAQGVNLTPDVIVRLRWEPERKREPLLQLFGHASHVQASVLFASCAASCRPILRSRSLPPGSAGTSAACSCPAGTRMTASSSPPMRVPALGGIIGDLRTLGGQDAVYDPVQGSLRALPVTSAYLGYERVLSRVFTTAVTYGVVIVNNLDIQPDDALHRTQRTSINLTRNPIPQADIVIEFLAGSRVNKNRERGLSSQIQAGWTLKF